MFSTPTLSTGDGAAIDGQTQLLFIVGSPVAQVKAPQRFNPLFMRRGLNAVMLPMESGADAFDQVVKALMQGRNVHGIIITVPYKFSAVALPDELGADGLACGAINAMVRLPTGRWHGDMFDGQGFVRGLRHGGHAVQGARALIVGAGGAGTAIASALLQAGAASIEVYDEQLTRGKALVHRLSETASRSRLRTAAVALALPRHSLVINATPAGTCATDPLPVDLGMLAAGAVVADVVMPSSGQTALLREAAARGHAVVSGHSMLDGQLQALENYFLQSLSPSSFTPASIS